MSFDIGQHVKFNSQTSNISHLVGGLKMNAGLLFVRKKKKKIQVSPHFLNENFLAAAKFPDTRSHECVVLRDRKN